jgi:hypothetical protein
MSIIRDATPAVFYAERVDTPAIVGVSQVGRRVRREKLDLFLMKSEFSRLLEWSKLNEKRLVVRTRRVCYVLEDVDHGAACFEPDGMIRIRVTCKSALVGGWEPRMNMEMWRRD